MPTFAYVIGVLSSLTCVLIYTDGFHQKWWRIGCPCARSMNRQFIREFIMQTYRGLFLSPNSLGRLPVIKPEGAGTHTGTYVGNILPSAVAQEQSCCGTQYAFEVFNFTVSQQKQLKVVHFDKAFQFVPTGRCPTNKTCGEGKCIQMYRHHWLLVWDERLPLHPPVTFVPVEVPSHCDCVNIGA
ncbi:hypothetical protein FSP39_023364 [Pinctada imbricata]|uniref:Spaetzle domain-containing protein n=1 Tax=Pinctada imbricata TaxID=66713 RepID=A0AA89BWG3_PINIB|nr:hypothetical protein FSP39_023364 [Pinctada imbricata]